MPACTPGGIPSGAPTRPSRSSSWVALGVRAELCGQVSLGLEGRDGERAAQELAPGSGEEQCPRPTVVGVRPALQQAARC